MSNTVVIENRIQSAFEKLGQSGRNALIPYTILGFPDDKRCLAAIESLIRGGADVLELGLPFSDPMADGPIIEAASKRLVENGFSIDRAINLISEIRRRHPNIPITVLSYFNLAFARGNRSFLQDLKDAGADGITFVDLPIEECEETYMYAQEIGLCPIMLVSPLTKNNRLERILHFARGYIYLVSRAGITGLDERFDNRLQSIIAAIKERVDLPVCVGFGISKREHVLRMLANGADGVIVGSKVIELQEDASNIENGALEQFLNDLSGR